MKISIQLPYVSTSYVKEITWFRDYLKNTSIDIYQFKDSLRDWLEEEHEIWFDAEDEELNERLDDYLNNIDPKIANEFESFIKEEIDRNPKEILEYNGVYDADWPTWCHMTLNSTKPIPRDTWLIHFSDHALDIANLGFKFGSTDMERLGLTRYFSDKTRMYTSGYNFAFIAESVNSFDWDEKKYGDEAVMFQSSGIGVNHFGDNEHQVIFWGPSVNPRDIIHIARFDGDACVQAKKDWKKNGKRGCLFQGDIKKAVKWVMQNRRQYSKLLEGK